jgi:hypothetical protein
LRPETITAIGLRSQITTIRLHPPAFHTVGELGFEYFFKTILQSRLENRKSDFDAALEVALHPVRRSEPKKTTRRRPENKKGGQIKRRNLRKLALKN